MEGTDNQNEPVYNQLTVKNMHQYKFYHFHSGLGGKYQW